MKKRKNSLSSFLSDLTLIVGAALISVGVGMIYFPAGLITGGIFLVVGGVLEGLSGGDSS